MATKAEILEAARARGGAGRGLYAAVGAPDGAGAPGWYERRERGAHLAYRWLAIDADGRPVFRVMRIGQLP